MTDLFRFARVAARALLSPQTEVFDPVTLDLVAMPRDCDSNLHVNNGRYLQLMDLGRLALVARAGLARPMIRHRWGAVVGAVEIEFLREIPILSSFRMTTRIVGWDPKWFFLEQTFERGGELAAIARVQGLFRAAHGTVPTAEVLAEVGPWQTSPRLPREFAQLSSPSPFRAAKRFTVDDLPGLDGVAA
jgi:acyl-CoA thioesterase FadM